MRHQEFEAPAPLQDIVKCFWYNRMDFGESESDFEVQPDGYTEIIFHFGGGCSLVQDGGVHPLPSPFIMGLQKQPVVFTSNYSLEIIGIRCFPWTVNDLLGLRPGPGCVRLFEHPVARLQSSLQNWLLSGHVAEAVAEVAQYFLDARPMVVDTTLCKAGGAMRDTNGTLPVSRVAAAAHATVRTLERKFRQSSGHTVKDVSALMRFEQVRNHLWLYPQANLAGLALETGYADQAHLGREFKRYSGTTPSAFARRAGNRSHPSRSPASDESKSGRK